MYLKAKLFGDTEIMKKIIGAHDPSETKALGLQVSGFNKKICKHYRHKFMLQAARHKFSQDPSLGTLLLSTEEKYLVEAAGYDPLFGIGLWQYKQGDSKGCKVDETAFDVYPKDWPGVNILGLALMQVREELKNSAFRKKGCSNFYSYYFEAADYLNN